MRSTSSPQRTKILMMSSHVLALYLTRKELIRKLVDDGHEVFASCPDFIDVPLENLGCKVIRSPVDRRGLSPVRDLRLLIHYILLVGRLRPDAILSYNIKPNIYGGLAAAIWGVKQIANVTGAGEVFFRSRPIAVTARFLYTLALRRTHIVFFQNKEDRELFREKRILYGRSKLIPGSGINLADFAYTPPEAWRVDPVFILFARAKAMKGIAQYVAAAEIVKSKYPNVRFQFAGPAEDSPVGKQIQRAVANGTLEYLGFVRDVIPTLKRADCTVLASLGGEGVPNVLLEGAAIGRLCIATRVAGSTDVVIDSETGLLCEPGDVESLVRAFQRAIEMGQHEKSSMAKAARTRIERKFDREIVIDSYLAELS